MPNWQDLEKKYYMQVFNRLPIVLVRGEGTRVWDENGKCYLDMVAGLAVNILGHATRPSPTRSASRRRR